MMDFADYIIAESVLRGGKPNKTDVVATLITVGTIVAVIVWLAVSF